MTFPTFKLIRNTHRSLLRQHSSARSGHVQRKSDVGYFPKFSPADRLQRIQRLLRR
jgi:hypothetical protein